ncbi:sugar phosphate isomerase/epimerase family protein [Rufibacter roseus]|uniref:Sugar phosphate isomerase/epimerase family protein n=1 Tax=Rufibacter roseus TaxID=1567108 RepID=A0ABW2DH74_9BACT|nr:TIM barrel protein [Rufibacter roseus]
MKNRRNFLQQLGLLSAGVAFAPAILTSCDSSTQKNTEAGENAGGTATTTATTGTIKDIGLQLYTLRELLPHNIKDVVRKVAEAGYNDVETYGYSVKDGYWGLDPKQFKELLSANNIVSSSGHYDFAQFMTDGNPDIVKRYTEAGKTIGQTYITVPWLAEELRNSLDDYKHIAQRLNNAGQLCQEAGLKLAYHNHDFEFTPYGNTSGFEVLLQETDPALVNFEADLYWIVRAGHQPVDIFQKNQGRFVMWHVKDMDNNSPDLNTEIGAGSIDYQSIFDKAEVSGVDRIFVEQENFAANMDPFQSIKQSHSFVKDSLLA